MVLVDGDPQQMKEVQRALSEYLTNAMFTNCGFHLVTVGWDKLGVRKKRKDGAVKKKQFEDFVALLKFWLYSFMRPGYCENKEEYTISKTFLFSYLKSKKVNDILGREDVEICEEWVRKVLTHENSFLYYQRKHLRAFYQITTSPHEGTNFGIKSHAASVRPCHTMTKADRSLALQSELKMRYFEHQASVNLINNKLWSHTATSAHIVTVAESIVQQTAARIDSYKSTRIGDTTWEVSYDKTTTTEVFGESHVPDFMRIRLVKLVNGCLLCDCFSFAAIGLPCAHCGSVLKTFSSTKWNGFHHHDVHPCWWNIWHKFAYSDEIDMELLTRLHVCKDLCKGPQFSSPIAAQDAYAPASPTLPAKSRIKNYTPDFVESILESAKARDMFEGLSQSSNVSEHGFVPKWDEMSIAMSGIEDLPSSHNDIRKHTFHELNRMLDDIKAVQPDKAKEVLKELCALENAVLDKCRAILRNIEGSKNVKTNNVPKVVNIMPVTKSNGIRRALRAKNAYNGSKSIKKRRLSHIQEETDNGSI